MQQGVQWRRCPTTHLNVTLERGTGPGSQLMYMQNLGSSTSSSNTWQMALLRLLTSTCVRARRQHTRAHVSLSKACWGSAHA